ncbi:hypothetical protein Thiosp_01652 [Thiorhodovibrio litoralis]|nr:hypothetical protein Thiosp_01652 [Thiorhodovibrio litoralis]
MTTLESIKETVKRELPDKKEQNRKWEANQVELAPLHEESLALCKRIDRSIGALGAGWGLRSEKAFRDALAGILEKSLRRAEESLRLRRREIKSARRSAWLDKLGWRRTQRDSRPEIARAGRDRCPARLCSVRPVDSGPLSAHRV